MAQFMNKNIHASKIPSCKVEIKRLTALMESAKTKLNVGNLMASFCDREGITGMLEQKKIHDDFYNSVINYMEIKIMAWEQFVNYAKDENMLDRINESMDNWLQKGWLYFGQEHIQSESKNAKDEYAMFKFMMTSIPNKTKKPRRRGGKKHKKKNKDVWDEVM